MFQPVMTELKEDGYEIEMIDIDTDQDKAVEKNIRSVPTTIIYNDDEEIERFMGGKSKDEIRYWMTE